MRISGDAIPTRLSAVMQLKLFNTDLFHLQNHCVPFLIPLPTYCVYCILWVLYIRVTVIKI